MTKRIITPFAASGDKNTVPDTAPVTDDGYANYPDGFPPSNSVDPALGGYYVKRADFNGVLNDVTTILRDLAKGLLYTYDATYSTAISGYPANALVSSLTGGLWLNVLGSANTSNPDTGGVGWKRFAVGLEASGISVVTTTSALTAAMAGGLVRFNSGTAIAPTLPAASTYSAGKLLRLVNSNAGVATVTRAGSDTITVNSATVTTIAMGLGDTLELISDGISTWYAVGGSSQLNSSRSLKGDANAQFFPSGWALQVGFGTTDASGYVTFTYPFAYLTGADRNIIAPGSNNCVVNSQYAATAAYTTYLIKTSGGAVPPVGSVVNFYSYGKVY